MPKGIPMGQNIGRNEMHQCRASGCNEHRFKLSPFCYRHWARARRTGDPLGTTPDPRQWRWERQAVGDLFQANPHHAGLVRALGYLEGWSNKAKAEDHRGNHWQQEVARVLRHGITNQDILVEVCAAWSWLQRHQHKVASDRALTFSIGHAVLKLAPRARTLSAMDHAQGTKGYIKKAHWRSIYDVGTYMRTTLAPLLVNVHEAIRNQEDAAIQAVADLRSPFNPTQQAVQKVAAASPGHKQ